MTSLADKKSKVPLWLTVVLVISSIFYICLEAGHMVSRDWDQETLFYSYNEAFLKMAATSHSMPQWNPYIQSGVSLHANLPFPLSLSRLLSILTGSGVIGFVLSRILFAVIGGYFLFALFKKFGLQSLSCFLVLFLYLEYQLCHLSHEALAMNVAIAIIYGALAFAEKHKAYIIILSGILLGVALNDYAPHGILAIFPLQLLGVLMLRKEINWKSHLFAVCAMWFLGVLISLPTLLPEVIDVKASAKIATLKTGSNISILNLLFFVNDGFVMRLSRAMHLLLALALGAVPLYWKTYDETTKGFIKSCYVFILLLASFFFFKNTFDALPVVGKIFVAFEPMRPTVLAHYCALVLLGIAVDRLIFAEVSQSGKHIKVLLFIFVFAALFFCSNYTNIKLARYSQLLSKPNILVSITLVPVIVIFYFKHKFFKYSALLFILLSCAVLWVMSGTRYYTQALPEQLNPFEPLKYKQVSIFPEESKSTLNL